VDEIEQVQVQEELQGSSQVPMMQEEDSSKPKVLASSSIYNYSDVPLTVSVELGVSEINIHDLLQIQKGSVIELDKLAGEPLEVLVNGRLVSRGEVVVINENYGLRLTDIINPDDQSKVKTQDD